MTRVITEYSAVEYSAAEQRAMLRALEIAATPGVPLGPNPRVGCVLLDDDGIEVAEGFHRGAGTPHAEAAALAEAAGQAPGDLARGTTAVVTLEPCNHTGRTGPCAQALIDAGVRRVVFAQSDPNPVAAGGAETLRAAGVDVAYGLHEDAARRLNRAWTFAVEHQRPFVTWKFATTLDGRSAAADGTSRWVSSLPARRDTHRLRGECDVMMVGANTVDVDDPELTVRDELDQPVEAQPLRVVMGLRDLPATKRIFNDLAESLHLRTHDPREALQQVFDLGRRHVFLEGGPTLAAAFLEAGLIDEVVTYVAPMLLGAGRNAVADLGISTIADALHFAIDDVTVLGTGAETNIRLTMTPSSLVEERAPASVSKPHTEES
ncbi:MULTISPECIES: bifunctional diaminohydroxyphosphoribosylaminopyrimidine deaminase/5-amino-6-(5-phosphoribosylamino)uracil reductase RibD [unclassified Nocardioides]|uniref:bifunctional diaminohydroxyphosphoribosylaminopyrimidine deaminase/5-amino-6-(5-phosphoribosylamino)uracil reductase RibD n=1 Tax=unclassified Nocardioides TaxID=2615069 RepID=UPI0006F792B8|nr:MULTISPECIES: bifunctional diaminohydroxyphosphoribosylaminopyrimidine deaminase/5-amino-6-(5-phosphoribosylamino)uracil reductase RibD [unclassified Nocardioides]KQY54226.1 bifunctional diaminohydroxyphosphoribosylaminopyrimidine deaminase/5-amino-6-(5-phosphoribosylamino)uracil reductase [Nocardioides sp. Root140]KRF10355.1 bifunctional diaminohydroxyphosphoribosylaminopyrimidine deaminase/5-amino-6-(5-phosphoribosylamino)uracil reductase [Nocardioides sp. Soil796]